MKVLTKKYKIIIDTQHCKGCELCVINCPQKILILSDKINKLGYRYVEITNEENCTACGRCYLMCPDYLIEIYIDK